MKYNFRRGLISQLSLGMLVAMAGEGAGGGATLLDFDDLNDLDLDDIADLAISQIADSKGFVLPPIGKYKFVVTECDFGEVGKEGQKKKAIVAKFEIRQTIELQDDEATPVAEGTEVGLSWMGGGVQRFKTIFGAVGAEIGANDQTTLRQFLPMLVGKTYEGFIGHRKDKEKTDDKGQPIKYMTLSDVALVK